MSFSVFGYGSLIWKPGPVLHHSRVHDGYVTNRFRRFFQGSPDHRGTPEAPGRVVTLLPSSAPQDKVWGRVYVVPQEDKDEAIAQLTTREIAGYSEEIISVTCADGVSRSATVYSATEDNEYFLGHTASIEEIARQIHTSVGPCVCFSWLMAAS